MDHSFDAALSVEREQIPRPRGRKAAIENLGMPTGTTFGAATGNFLPFGKRPFGCRPLPALAQKPEHVFLIGREPLPLQEREELLHKAGYHTLRITPEAAIQESRKPQLAISVFCHSLTSLERVQLAASFRRYSPETRLLLVSQRINLNFEVMLFHSVVALEDGPDALIEAVNRLAKTA